MSDGSRTRSQFAQSIWDYRFKFLQLRMAVSKVRLGSEGKRYLSRLLNLEEVPFGASGVRFERAYRKRWKDKVYLGGEPKRFVAIVAERSFVYPGMYRFVNIFVKSHPSVEAAEYARDHLAESVKKRYAHGILLHVKYSQNTLADFPMARVLEARIEYDEGASDLIAVAQVHEKCLVQFELQGPSTNPWALSDCETVVQLQSEKLRAQEIEDPAE